MIKSLIILVVSTIACSTIQAQSDQSLAKANRLQKVAKPADKPVLPVSILDKNILPLFGETNKNENEKAADKIFVAMCSTNFPNLTEASKFFAERGWEYLAESELDTAIHRFNLSYLLNNNNADAYWGLGVISFQKGDLEKAAHILKKGVAVDSTNASLMVDLASVELSCFEKNQTQAELVEAHKLLTKAVGLDPSNIFGWHKRSETEYYLGNYENAWECIHSVRLLDISKIDLTYVGKLAEKMKDPKEIFKF